MNFIIHILPINNYLIFQLSISNITLKIKGKGYNKIFSSYEGFQNYYYPSEIYINGNKQKNINHTYYFNDTHNYVELIWNNGINNSDYIFYKCLNITEIDLSNFNTSQVTSMNHMFDGCASLTSINLSYINTQNITLIGYMFYNCISLTSLDLYYFNISYVTNMDYMFYNCNSLTSLDLSKFNTTKVTSMSSMFNNCISLTSLNLSNFNTSNVINMDFMFYNCLNLRYLNLQNFSGIKLSDSGYKNIFDNISENAVICIKDTNYNMKILDQIKNKKCYTIDCSDEWPSKIKRINTMNNKCIDNCIISAYYEYNYKCFNECPNRTKIIEAINPFYCEQICPLETPFLYINDNKCNSNCNINKIKDNKCVLNYNNNESNIYEKENLMLKNIFE